MIIKSVTVEKVDEDSKFVLKRVMTNETIFMARQIPINNTLFLCEQERKKRGKPLLSSSFQIHHIHADRKNKFWMYNKDLAQARQHAKENRRIFIPYQQKDQGNLIELGSGLMLSKDLKKNGMMR